MANAFIFTNSSSAMSPVIPRSAIPSYSRSRSRSIRAAERFEPIAWRSSSDSAGVNPATSMAICISCSWNSGTPSVLARLFSSSGWRYVTGSWPLRRRMYGCTDPPWIGPGRISATSTTRS